MGLFSALSGIAGDWLEFKGLDLGSDNLIAKVCPFDPALIRADLKSNMTESIRRLWQANRGSAYTTEEIALYKLASYSQLFENDSAFQSEYEKVQRGLNKIYTKCHNEIRPEIGLRVMAERNGSFLDGDS